MAEYVRVPGKEVLVKRGRRALFGTVVGFVVNRLKGYLPTVKAVHKVARDTLKRPDYAGHMVLIPSLVVGGVMLADKYDEYAKDMMFTAGMLAGEIIDRELAGEPIIRLYTDHIELERFDASAEIHLIIDGVVYDASKFTTPAEYGTIDTSTGKIYTDADGKFKASFAEALPEGEHTVCVSTGDKGKCIRVEI